MSGTPSHLLADTLFSVKGRVAVVTGGGSGLGRAIAETLLANGASVLIAGREAEALERTAAELAAGGGAVAWEAADVTDDAAVEAMLDSAEQAFGPVDTLFCAAGVAVREKAVQAGRESFSQTFAVNVESAFCVARAAADRMIGAGTEGSIVMIGSYLNERPMRGVASYAASKAAVHQLSRVLALEWARHGIRVNEIVPGWYPTAMTDPFLGGRGGEILGQINPMRRLGTPADLAGAVLLLASNAGAYITGASLTVDGGQSLT